MNDLGAIAKAFISVPSPSSILNLFRELHAETFDNMSKFHNTRMNRLGVHRLQMHGTSAVPYPQSAPHGLAA